MQAHNAKQEALEAIQSLPDNVDWDEIMYRVYVLNKIHAGLEDLDAARTIPHDQVLRELEQW